MFCRLFFGLACSMKDAIRMVVGGEESCLPVTCSAKSRQAFLLLRFFSVSFTWWLFLVSWKTLS